VRESLTERFVTSVGCHFVMLPRVQTVPGDPTENVLVFYVTAEHILRRIRSALEAGAQFDIWPSAIKPRAIVSGDTAIPFAFDIDRWGVIEKEEVWGLSMQLRRFELTATCIVALAPKQAL
jgi:hypothetical protein